MAINPMTGEMDYNDFTYDPQNMTAGIGMRGVAKGDVDVPLIFGLAESIPGLSTTSMVNSRRYANTLFKGGFADVDAGTTGRKLARAQKLGAFVGDSATKSSSMFFGGASNSKFLQKRASKAAANANRTPFMRQSFNTNLKPKAFNRLTSLTALTGDKSLGFYTPFQSTSGAVGFLSEKSASVRKLLRIPDGSTEKAFSGGVLGRIESINRINNLESTIARGTEKLASGGVMSKRQSIRHTKALAQKTQLINNIAKVQSLANPAMNAVVNNPAAIAAGRAAPTRAVTPRGLAGARTAAVDDAITNAAARMNFAKIEANPMKAVASTMTVGRVSNAITSFYAGVVDPTKMSKAQKLITKRVTGRLGGIGGFSSFVDEFAAGGKYAGNFLARTGGGVKMMGMAGQYLQSGGSRAVAARFAGMGALRAAGGLMTPLNVLATGQLIYDIASGAGKLVASGIGTAKDALKSMQGSISKPMFGTGFKDNEVAATSRSRGVMAIQNSRLNARSLLGSEAGMMAAHFG